MKYTRVAIVYDRVNKIGGAERVLESLFKIYPKATLYTSVYDRRRAKWAQGKRVVPSFLQKIPFLTNRHELIPYLMPLAFESFSFAKHDLVISVTSEAAKGVVTPVGVKHICLCLTPTRYLWSGYTEYFKNQVLRTIGYPVILYLKKWDLIASSRPDIFIAISKNVKARIAKYYKRDSHVIYPPSDLLFEKKYKDIRPLEKEYFLVVSRLTPYKKVDLAIKAANKLKLNLVVIGEGSEWEKLDAIAGPTISFKGKVSDEVLYSYYKYSKALIFPGEEDFGITMVESQLTGKPVVAYKGGGAVEIIKEGKTGVFFTKQTVASLVSVLKKFKSNRYNSGTCKNNGKRFSERKFVSEMTDFINSI